MAPGLRILYVHGYLGSAHGHSSELIRHEFDSRGIPHILDAPGFNVTNPIETKKRIISLIETKHYDYVVASSLGAFYTMQIPDIKKILINPALPENLMRIRDLDPNNNCDLTSEFFYEIDREKDVFFSEFFNAEFRQNSYVIYGTRDMIAPNEDFLEQYYNDESRVFHVDMEHKLDEKGAYKVFQIIYMDY